MFLCPRCHKTLERLSSDIGPVWACKKCHGKAFFTELFRHRPIPEQVRKIWTSGVHGPIASSMKCPSCQRSLEEVKVKGEHRLITTDLCRPCHVLWLDAGEFEALPKTQVEEPFVPQAIGPHSQKYRYSTRQFDQEQPLTMASKGSEDSLLLGLLGLPCESNNPLSRTPWLTYVLVLMIAGVSIWGFGHTEALQSFSFIPAMAWRFGGSTWLTHFFLHAGWIHLLSNLYFFVVCGDNCEDVLGSMGFLLLLALATMSGAALWLTFQPNMDVPGVGASGGISGLMVFYACQFPHSRFSVLWYFRFVSVPAVFFVAFWFLKEVFGGYLQIKGFGGVNHLAHLGGAVSGFLFWLTWRFWTQR